MSHREELLAQLRSMPSSLNDACRTMEMAASEIERLRREESRLRDLVQAYSDMAKSR